MAFVMYVYEYMNTIHDYIFLLLCVSGVSDKP